jgi:hypothetical protein
MAASASILIVFKFSHIVTSILMILDYTTLTEVMSIGQTLNFCIVTVFRTHHGLNTAM